MATLPSYALTASAAMPINLITYTRATLERRSGSPLHKFETLVKTWYEWGTVEALANFRPTVDILCDFLREDSVQYQRTHKLTQTIAHEIFDKMTQDHSRILGQMLLIFRDPTTYKDFLACRGSMAQQLLDLVQDLLDSSIESRPLLSKALIRLTRASGLYPRCFTLPGAMKIGKQVAAGGFGDIYQCSVGKQTVAVKMMRLFRDSDVEAARKAYGHEAVVWRQLSHPNLLPFFGLYFLEKRLCLVSPWMENGHIMDFLRDVSPDHDRLALMLDIANGLKYLHMESIIHGDLKPTNILITPLGRACIADFGLSSISEVASLNFPHSTTKIQGGTVRYQAPEVMQDNPNHYGSDIYALGCVYYEIMTGKVPFSEVRNEVGVILKVIDGARPSVPEASDYDPSFWSLLLACWRHDPGLRPSVYELINCLVKPPIAAKTIRSAKDWDEASTSKFRCHNWPPVQSITEIGRQILGDETFEEVYEGTSPFLILSSPCTENEILFKKTDTTNDDVKTISLPYAPADLFVGSVVLFDSTRRMKYLDQSPPTETPSRFSDHDAGCREDNNVAGRSLLDNKATIGRTDETRRTLGRRGVDSGGADGDKSTASRSATHHGPPKPLNYVLFTSDTTPAYVVCFMCSIVDIFRSHPLPAAGIEPCSWQ
ncbi:kinase-like domain-containing protein [Mycena metata]|uniref:Kinase-like domain-containing protein n=1 Tax=Mycena metata TaxID=1033252 RepID=A0AAD7HBY9_9AGAR|nr:kinase-like domain-containing protein [Mycena metata]